MKTKKTKLIFFFSLLIIFLSSCSKETYIDRHELALRLKNTNTEHYFEPQNAIIKNNKQYVFLSLIEEDDCLLTLYVDSSDRIKSLSLTLSKDDFSLENLEKSFLPFCENILNSFLNDEKAASKALKSLNTFILKNDKKAYYKSLEIGGHVFYFYANELSYVFECAYI